MPSKFKIRKGKEVIDALEKLGFVEISQKGSHIKFRFSQTNVVVPNHTELAIGTLNAIYKVARSLANSDEVDDLFLN